MANATTQNATGLIKSGAGVMLLSAANTFSGTTSITGGTLTVANPLALQNSTVNLTNNNSLAFSVSAGTLGGLGGSANVNLGSAALAIGNNGANTTYSGVMSGGAGLTKIGGGMTTLTAAQNYAVSTTVSAGTLQLGAANVLPVSLPLVLAPGTSLDLNGGAQQLPALSDATPGTGGTILNSLASTPGTLTVETAGSSTFSGQISGGTVNFVMAGTGVQSLAGNNNNLGTGLVAVNGGTLQIAQSTASLTAGQMIVNTATVVQPFGTVTLSAYVNGALTVGGTSGMTANYIMSSGTLNATSTESYGAIGVGTNGSAGTFTQTGGLVKAQGYVPIGRDTGGVGVYSITGGTLMADDPADGACSVEIGESGLGTLSISGGGFVSSATAIVLGYGSHGAGTGTINLGSGVNSGGTLSTVQINVPTGQPSAIGTLNFNGGVLLAHTSASSTLLSNITNANVLAGGAIINSNGQNITVSQALTHASALGATPDGGLTKAGAGTLTLTATQSYTGPTVVSGGVLKLQGPQVATGASIGVHFEGNGGTGSGNLAANGAGQGATMNNWMNLSATTFTSATALTDNNSNATTASFTATYSGGGYSTGDSIGLLNGYLYISSGGSLTLNVTGIPYPTYSLYAYAGAIESADTGRDMQIAIGGQTYYVLTNLTPTTYTQVTNTSSYTAGDYEMTAGLTGTSATLVDYAASGNGALNGFEIVATGPAPNVLPTTTALKVASGSTLDLGGGNPQVASLSDVTPGNGGTILNSSTLYTAVLTLTPTGSTTFSGVIAGGGANGVLGLALSGRATGVQVLTGGNTYTGPTSIVAGLLRRSRPRALAQFRLHDQRRHARRLGLSADGRLAHRRRARHARSVHRQHADQHRRRHPERHAERRRRPGPWRKCRSDQLLDPQRRTSPLTIFPRAPH